MLYQVGGIGRGCIPGRNAWVRGNHHPGSAPVSEGLALPTAIILLDKRLHEFICAEFSPDIVPGSLPKAEDHVDLQGVDDTLVEGPAGVCEFAFVALQVNGSRAAHEDEIA